MKTLLVSTAVLVFVVIQPADAAPGQKNFKKQAYKGAQPVIRTPISPANPYEAPGKAQALGRIDELVFKQLAQNGIEPAAPCPDAVFLRRVYLDVIGTLPTGFEAREFLLDQNPGKRKKLISKLLEDDRFASYWAMKWSDVLRIKAEFPINLWPNAAQAYHRWVYASIKDRMPYDQFVRELLTSNGSNFRVPAANFYRAMQNREPSGLAQGVALTFMGARADKWPKQRLDGMAAFFSQIAYKPTGEWKEEIVMFDPSMATNGLYKSAVFPDGKPAALAEGQDPRVAFADWLIDARNPWFAKAIANRTWSWLLGRGIVQEPDDIRPDNPPSNPELLAYLERELVNSKYDLKHLFQVILESGTYQLSSIAKTTNSLAEANFASYPIRRLEAEVLIDALNQITGTSEKYTSAVPEPPTVIPDSLRAVDLADASVTSSFLELFGRPSRDTGYESERNNRPTAAQRLHLLNSSHIQQKIEQSQMIRFQTGSNRTPREIATGIYLGILSRFPTEQELQQIADYVESGGVKPRDAAVDLAWALINSSEFLTRH